MTGYTFREVVARMGNVSLMHKKRIKTAHDFVWSKNLMHKILW